MASTTTATARHGTVRRQDSQTRRQFLHGSLAFIGAGLLSGCGGLPFPGRPPKVSRIGFLSPGTPASATPTRGAFVDGLQALGLTEGQSLVIETRYAEGNFGRLPALGQELASLPVDAIFAGGEQAAQAALEATAEIPIVTVV